MPVYKKKIELPVSAEKLFSWHEQKCAFNRLAPPWESLTLTRKDPSLEVGTEVHFKLQKGPFSLPWIARHIKYNPPHEFEDTQIKGPFTKWVHQHKITALNDNHSELEDVVTFKTPFGIGDALALNTIDRMFCYRHDTLFHDLLIQQKFPSPSKTFVLIDPTQFFISSLGAFLQTAGHTVIPISSEKKTLLQSSTKEPIDAVVDFSHYYPRLVKENNIFKNVYKNLQEQCDAFIQIIPETSTKEEFSYKKKQVYQVHAGLVISASGGLLQTLLPLFYLGLGNSIAHPNQWLHWIGLDDFIYQIYPLLTDKIPLQQEICSPNPVRWINFAKIIASTLKLPWQMPLPQTIISLTMSRMHLSTPKKGTSKETLIDNNNTLFYPHIEDVLSHTLGMNSSINK